MALTLTLATAWPIVNNGIAIATVYMIALIIKMIVATISLTRRPT